MKLESMQTRKTKLLIITDYFYPHWTGISKSIFSLTQSLQSQFEITVLTVRFRRDLKREEKLSSVSVIRTDHIFTLSRSKYSVSILLEFLKRIKTTDAVLINSPSANILPLSVFTKLFGKRLYIFHQGDLILPKGIINKIIERLFDLSCFVAFYLADKASTYTKDYAEYSRVLRPFLSKCYPLLMPIKTEVQKHSSSPVTKTLQSLKKGNTQLFGFAGRFVEEKGFDILFDAIPKILLYTPHARFVFAGETDISYENFFHKNMSKFEKVKDHVSLLGLLNDREMAEFYHAVTFMIVPSRSDSFNLVQAEAIYCGTPVIASNIPGLRFLVKETGFGVLFESENPTDLAEKTIEAIEKRDKIMLRYKLVQEILQNTKNVKKIREFLTS